MRVLRRCALAFLVLLYLTAAAADWIAPSSYQTQFRDHISAAPSIRFPLGTDELGRDRLSRVLHGSRVSLLLAPAAALLSTFIAASVGGLAGYLGGAWERSAMLLADLFNSLPWLFLLITARAMLPLNVSGWTSVAITFLLLSILGWASSARMVRASTAKLWDSAFCTQARASGAGHLRLLLVHILPNLKPLLRSQFWISIPVFILSEANLGMLGLGVTEPLPSWGNLLAEFENIHAVGRAPWLLAPAILLVLAVSSFYFAFAEVEGR